MSDAQEFNGRPICQTDECLRPSRAGCHGFCQDCYTNKMYSDVAENLNKLTGKFSDMADVMTEYMARMSSQSVTPSTHSAPTNNTEAKLESARKRAANVVVDEPTFMPEISKPKAALNLGSGGIESRESE